MNERVAKLRALLEEPLLVTNPTNVRYLTGFVSSNPALLVDPERDTPMLYTDFRYADAARGVGGVEFVETKRNILEDLAGRLTGRIAVESAFMTIDGLRTFESGGLEVVPRGGLVERLRAVKDERELDLLRQACAITDRVFERLADEPFVGRRERDVAWRIAELFHEEGAGAPAFELIVASGPNAAKPHGRAGDRVIGPGEAVVVDAGCTVGGYFSDYTRTFATGRLDGRLDEAYAVCLAAQEEALRALRAGMNGVDADRLARSVVEQSDFAGTFGHGLGHGLGLDIHEAPRLSAESDDTLTDGNVVTVEPGLYLSGVGGIRIEDDVVIRDGGVENLTSVRKELVEVG